jgi:tetratricopeptide (TPR) repeat protein
MKTKEASKPDRPAPRPMIRRIINLRLLVETLIVAAIIAPAAYFWYYFQMQRTAGAMLERANKLAAENDHAAAAQYYFQYLKLKPRDVDAQILLAETFDRAAKGTTGKAQAVEYYYQALGAAPSDKQPALRRRLAELLIELRRFVQAEEEARELLKTDPNDAQVARLLALALFGQSRSGSLSGGQDLAAVGEAVEQANKLNPGDMEIAFLLAEIYRNRPELLDREKQSLPPAEREKLADQTMDDMVAAKPNDAEVLLARHRYRQRYQRAAAEEDLSAAIKSHPDDLEVLLQAASDARRAAARLRDAPPADVQARLDEAQKHYERAIELFPKEERPYLGLADLYMREGKLDLAAKTLRDALEKTNGDGVILNATLAETLLAQNRLDEADQTIAGLERTAERVAPLQPQPVKLAFKRMIDSLRGRWLAMKGRHLDALEVLRRVAVGQQTAAEEIARSFQAWLWLGRTYAALDQWDQAANAYEQAAALDPKAVAPRLEAAVAWIAAERPDMAEPHLRSALSSSPTSETWLLLARVLLQRQLRLPVESRNWEAFDQALAEAKKPQSSPPANAWRLNLLEADYLIARGEEPQRREQSLRDALALCRAAESEHPDAVGLLPPLAAAYERLDQHAEADRVLERLAAVKGQEAVACLLKARFRAGRKEFDEARKILIAGLETLPEKARPAIASELVQLDLREGRTDSARARLLELHAANPANPAFLKQLAELDLETGKLSEVENWENELQKLEGDNGLFWRYFRAKRLLAEAAGGNDPKLVEAAKLLAAVQTQRPTWSKAYLLQGNLFEARGRFDEAIESYREAIRLGERLPQAFQRLIGLLLQTNQADEADQYLAMLHDRTAASESYSSLESVVAARRGQLDRALEAARRNAESRPDDFMAQLWLGQLLAAADKTAEAETALKKAVESAPNDARALGGLFAFYVRAKRQADASELLRRIAENEKIDPLQRASFLAQGYELLDDAKQAETYYREAARLDADGTAAKVRLAGFLLRSGASPDDAEAERLLREALRASPDSAPARRFLAGLLVERGGEKQWQEACRLMEEPGKDGLISSADRRLQAIIFSRRGGKENLDHARRILEELLADPKRAADVDRRLLARLYEADGNIDAARRQLLKLAEQNNASLADQAAYVQLLLRYDLLDEADARLKTMEARRPDDLGTAALRAQWLKGRGQADKIEPLLEPLAEKLVQGLPPDSPEYANALLSMGNLYSMLEQHQSAERWYRRLHALQPESYPLLAGALARAGRMKEAVELCADAAKSNPSALPAITVAVSLMAGKPSADDFKLAEPLLEKAAADHKDDPGLLSALAGVRVVQKRIDEAAGLYRRALELKPDDLATLNNLATLLSEQSEQREEAIRLIERAIEIAGPQPQFLDTKGTILMSENKPDDAIPLLEQAAASPLADPRYHFHLAAAYDRAGRTDQARTAFNTALKNHLLRQILTPSDQSLLAELQKKFE